MRQALARLWYRWSWRARYWWLDTEQGRLAQRGAFAAACVAVVLQLTHLMIGVATAPVADAPAHAVSPWVIQLMIFVAFAALSFLLRPKVEQPKPQEGETPVVEDGLAVREVYGTVWIEDAFLLAWKSMGTIAIKKKGGKK